MEIKTKHLLIFIGVGIVIMTLLIFNMQVRKQTMDAIQEQYEKGNISEEKYKAALADGKLTYWEALDLEK